MEFYFEGKAGEEEEIRKLLEKRNLCSVFLAGFPMKRDGVDITSPDERVRRKSVEFCRRMYERCQGLGAGKMLIVSGPAWKEKDGQALMGQACKSFEEIGTGIGGDGPEITLEFLMMKGNLNSLSVKYLLSESFMNRLRGAVLASLLTPAM